MSLRIRQATQEDAGLILDFIRELAAYENLADEVTATVEKVRATIFTDNPKAFVLIAEWDGAPCGFALYFFNYSTFLCRHGVYLEDLYVREEFRGRGIGKALLGRLAAIAEMNECGRLEWWVLDCNAPSIAFYKSLGAEAMEEWTVHRLTGDALAALARQDAG